jgi:hypothetical protein
MGQDREINLAFVIQNALNQYSGFTAGEKKYFNDKLVDWIAEDKSLNLLISKFSEKSLNIKPFLRNLGLIA